MLVQILVLAPFAGEPKGFGNLEFGTKKEKLVEKLVSKYKFESSKEGILGENGIRLHHSQSSIWMSNFPLGNYRVTVWMYFNANDKFYKFEFESAGYMHGKEDKDLKNQSEFLGQVFQTKYGSPEKKYSLSYLNLKEGYLSFNWKWSFKNSSAYTAYKLEGDRAAVMAAVFSPGLEKEAKISVAKPANEQVKDAVQAF